MVSRVDAWGVCDQRGKQIQVYSCRMLLLLLAEVITRVSATAEKRRNAAVIVGNVALRPYNDGILIYLIHSLS